MRWPRLLTATVLPLSLLVAAGCATTPRPDPLSAAHVVQLAKEGRAAGEIIEELKRTETVLPLRASDIVQMHEAGVPDAVLDYLQRVQIDEVRWRARYSAMDWYGPFYRGYGPCGWPPFAMRPYYYRGWVWGC